MHIYNILPDIISRLCDSDTAQVTFSSNVLLDSAGRRVPIGGATTWTPMARHTECGQLAVPAADGSGDVALRFRNESLRFE